MSVTQQISLIVEKMPERNQVLLLEFLKSLVIADDDVLTDEDIADIEQARAEFAQGEYVRHEDIDWD